MTLRREFFLIFLSPLVLVALGVGYLQATRAGRKAVEEVPGEALYREVLDVVRTRYVVEPDVDRLMYGAAQGIMNELDPHSRIYNPEDWASNRLRNSGQYIGIGVTLGKLRGRVSILEVLRDGPAARAGIKAGDRVRSVDGHAVADDASIGDVSRRIVGPLHTRVSLELESLGEETSQVVVVERGMATRTIVYGYLLDATPKLGYVHVESFRDTTVALFDQEMKRLLGAGMTALILDLRGNLGGSLDAAVTLADRFVSEGIIVTTEGRQESRARTADAAAPYGDLPTVVLVDGRSASASEVLAGALQDHGRAIILGERTYGKGVVQEVQQFTESGYPGGYKITTAHYFTPAGRCIERRVGLGADRERRGGLIPDIPMPMTPQFGSRDDADTWYGARDARRQRGRFEPEVQAILEEEEAELEDIQAEAAGAILRGEWSSDRLLRGER